MAEPLKYRPRVDARHPAHEELESLLRTLHESGSLRLLQGLSGRFPEVLGLLLEKSRSEFGQNALGNVTVLGASLGRVETAAVEHFTRALGAALERVHESAPEDPPRLLSLLGALRGADARRGLHALVILLQTLGEQLNPERRPNP